MIPSTIPNGILLLRWGGGRVIFIGVLMFQPGRYTGDGQYFNCDINRGDCVVFGSMCEMAIGPPSHDDMRAKIVRDARAGHLAVFSNAGKFLAATPW